MQSKGFIKVLTVALILVCAFYLSFSFVTSHYEGIAADYAKAKANTEDVSNDAYKTYYKQYVDSLAKEKVYLGYYTFQQAREMEVGLGLDLKGGMNVTLQISVPDILRALSNENPDPKFNEALAIAEKQQKNSAEKDFVGVFCREYNKLAPEGSLYQIFRGVEKLQVGASNSDVEKVLKDEVNAMVDNSYNVLRTRIDRFGVVSPNIQKLESTGRILLELPGVKEPERVIKLLKGTANLEFYETYTINDLQGALMSLNATTVAPVDTTAADSVKKETPKSLFQMMNQGRGGASIGIVAVNDTAAVNAILNSAEAYRLLPTNFKPRWSVKSIDDRGQYYELIALKTVQGGPVLTGDVVTDASSEFDQMQGQVVSMKMNDEGARQWARITQQNLNKAIAIVLDDQVYSFPNVNSVIEGGSSQITGNFTVEEANDLANVLKSGKMVARVNVESMSVIGPSLGREAIEAGFLSFIVALVLLMIFMVAIYGLYPGLVANLGLILNLFFTLGILASIQAVLTLPGIAGIVLAMGMAVDANVLIFERTKEELRAGKSLKAAVADGYSNAFSAIFDSNLTTVITALILLLNGSGPIKGFATTLIIGIVCSFFTAVFATRLVMEAIANRKDATKVTFNTKLSKGMMENVKFDFIGARPKVWTVVAILVLAVGVLLGVRRLSPGIDFSGGRNYTVQFAQPVSTEELKAQLAPLFPESNLSVITIDNDTKVRVSTNYKIDSTEDGVDDEIMQKLYEGLKSKLNGMSYAEFSVADETQGVISNEKVGPSIASDMTREACWAVFFSLIAMALYILIRFRNIAFSVGALCAVAFTAFLVIGFYGLYGMFPFSMEVDQNFIAAILTIIGYQVNDTVVVFDRVRESRTLYPKQDLATTFNHALNSTLARTTMTSVSTLLVLIVIFALGGESIRSFVFAMSLGVIFGTLASLFIAAPVACTMAMRTDKKATK
ncbi:MAG: protein translocase subunit SecD [Bacteroidales bacterium]|nr:protein translocase subunit SecD [Bacteroidales bacterium]